MSGGPPDATAAAGADHGRMTRAIGLSLLLALSLVPAAAAALPAPPGTVDLAAGSDGSVRFAPGAWYSGYTAEPVGDVNGDGIGDVAVTAQAATGVSSVFVLFGREGGLDVTLDASAPGAAGLRIDAPDGDGIVAVGPAGDVDGDGPGDVVVGLPYARGFDGDAYVVRWRKEPGVIGLGAPGYGFRIRGGDGERLGWSVGGGGDVDGDGRDDVVVGRIGEAPGAVAVWGKAGDATVEAAPALLGTQGLRIAGTGTGDDVRLVGDVNGDGRSDVGLGAGAADALGRTKAGRAWVVFGRAVAAPTTIQLSALDGASAAGLRIDGPSASAQMGAPAAAGDLDGDGFDDVVLGAPGD